MYSKALKTKKTSKSAWYRPCLEMRHNVCFDGARGGEASSEARQVTSLWLDVQESGVCLLGCYC